MERILVSLNRFELEDINELRIIDRLVLKLFFMSVKVSQEYGVLQLSY